MELSEIRIANFLSYIKEFFDNSINKFAKANNINVNQYYAIVRGERPFGDKVARNIEHLMGLGAGDLDKNPNNNELIFECPLIIEGEPIPKDPMTSSLKRKISSQALPNFLLEQMGITKRNIFIIELKTSLFPPAFNEKGVWVVEKFSGYFISNKFYLFNDNNNLFIYKVEKNISTTTLFDCNNKVILKISNDEENSILKCAIGRLRYGLSGGVM